MLSILGKYQYWLQFKLINLGIQMLPKDYRNKTFIENCIKTGHIEVSEEAPRKASRVKSGYDDNGMPYIDMSDPETAQVFKKRLEAFEGIVVEK